MDSIYCYLEYRRFLEDYYNAFKQANYFFSYRFMAEHVGIDASNLVKILQRKRHLPKECVPRVISFCKLDEREGQFFGALYSFNKARSEKSIRVAYEKLLSLKYVPANKIRRDQYEYYQKWYYSAIRSLLGFYRFVGNDFSALAHKLTPAITIPQAKEAIRLLERLKLIKRDKSGRYLPTNRHITTGEAWSGQAIRRYLPYPVPVSTHGTGGWNSGLNGPFDHAISQGKLSDLSSAAGRILSDYNAIGGKPAVNDENGYDPGEMSTNGVIEGVTGSFFGGGYGTTGHKSASKQGGYFWGHAARGKSITEHPSVDELKFLRESIDDNIAFWKMTPTGSSIFSGGDRALEWSGNQYVLGGSGSGSAKASLPAGTYTVVQFDIRNKSKKTLSASASGNYDFSLPSGSGITFFKKNGSATPDPQAITTEALPNATRGDAYSAQLQAQGGSSPYSWTITSGSLPEGLTLTANTIEGAPTTTGTASFTIQVTDSKSATESKSLSILVADPNAVDPLIITTVTGELSTAVLGEAYSDDLEATGGVAPYTWSADGLPAGINVSGSQLEGTPTAAGTFDVTLTVIDSEETTTSKAVQVTVSETTGNPGNGVVYDFTSLSSAPAGVTQNGGFWTSGGWRVDGNGNHLLIDLGSDLSSGTAEAVITLTGDPSAPGTKVNYFCVSGLNENTHYSKGSKAYLRSGDSKYGFSRFKAYFKEFDHTEHEHTIGSPGDWKTDGTTEHSVAISWYETGVVSCATPGGNSEVTYPDFGPIRYVFLGTYNYNSAISGMTFKSLTVTTPNSSVEAAEQTVMLSVRCENPLRFSSGNGIVVNTVEPSLLTVLDVTGRIILKKAVPAGAPGAISTSALARGFYIVRLRSLYSDATIQKGNFIKR